MKRLIVNADDFGLTPGVNEGILRAHRGGIVTSTTLMADGPAFGHAVELASSHASLDIGVHLVLWPENETLPQRLPSFVWRAVRWPVAAIEATFARQVERVLAAGITPSHLDTHKHTHFLPNVMSAVARTAVRFRIGWVRRPLFARQASKHGLRTTDHFTGIGLTGKMDEAGLLQCLDRLAAGTTELMCHPGICDESLRQAPTRLREHRQRELEALCSPAASRYLREAGIGLISYRQLAAEHAAPLAPALSEVQP